MYWIKRTWEKEIRLTFVERISHSYKSVLLDLVISQFYPHFIVVIMHICESAFDEYLI